jgi:ATP-binding protein involved in chromosome partitioning
VPIYEPIRIGGDTGVPITIGEPGSPAAEAFRDAARQLAAQLSIASYKQKSAIPLTPIA